MRNKYQENIVETFIRDQNGLQIKTVISPNVIHENEPNEVDIKVYNSMREFSLITFFFFYID